LLGQKKAAFINKYKGGYTGDTTRNTL